MLTVNKASTITMKSESPAAAPGTLAEVETIISKWCRSSSLPLAGVKVFRVSREGTPTEYLNFEVPLGPEITVTTKDRVLRVQSRRKKLELDLQNFKIDTRLQNQRLYLYIAPRVWSPVPNFMTALSGTAATKHPAFQARVLRAFQAVEEDLAAPALNDVLSAPNDFTAVIQALNSSFVLPVLEKENPILAAKLRGQQRKVEILKEAGNGLNVEDVATLLGISRQAVDKRRKNNKLLAVSGGGRGYLYPGFQFSDGKTVPGLELVLEEMTSLDPWMQLIFFTSPSERLGGKTPIASLSHGPIDTIRQAARMFGEQGAV